MKIFKQLTINDVQLRAFPFKNEMSMGAYLIENEGVLSLDDDTFKDVKIIGAELTLKKGRSSKGTDGRIDLLAIYSEGYIAIIELKNAELKLEHMTQLLDYEKEKKQILKKYPEIRNSDDSEPKWVVALVGNSIDSDLAKQIAAGAFNTDDTQVFALTMQRFRDYDGNIFVTTEIYFKSKKDFTQYLFEGKEYGKGKLVLAVLKSHCAKNLEITYSELERIFPKQCQGSIGVFATEQDAEDVLTRTGYRRHYLKPDEKISIKGSTIAVCKEWGAKKIDGFIECAKNAGHHISAKRKP